MTRRDTLATLGAAAAAAALPAAAAPPSTPAAPTSASLAASAATAPGADATTDSLDALAQRKGLRYGSAVGSGRRGSQAVGALRRAGLPEPEYLAVIRRECGVVVHENVLKWQALRPSAKEFRFEAADLLATWSLEQGLLLRGHTLLWHAPRWFPEWLNRHDFGATPVAEAERLLEEHIATVCARYGTRIGSYDVVNESVDPDTGALRDNVFTPHLTNLGQVELAFRLAHQHAPHAQLVYNDFMSWGSHSARHRAGVLALLQQLKARQVPVHALGLQSHLGTGADGTYIKPGGSAERDWRRFLDEVTALGLELLITELDVNDHYLNPDPARRDADAAAMVRGYLDVTLAYPQLRTVMSWGLADHHSWMRTWWPRADGLPKRPAPYDEQLRPKPLRDAMASALRAAPVRAPS